VAGAVCLDERREVRIESHAAAIAAQDSLAEVLEPALGNLHRVELTVGAVRVRNGGGL
jgi:hypothetical protein